MQDNLYRFERILNFRDCGGHRTIQGYRMNTGMIYRCGSLEYASKDDLKRLQSLGLKTICDLRTKMEIKSKPDRLPDATVNYVNVPVTPKDSDYFDSTKRLIALLTGKFRNVDFNELIKTQYGDFVLSQAEQFARVLTLLCDRENYPLIIHCTGGKDRTGFACALIQATVGVPMETVISDYLLSNSSTKQLEVRLKRSILIMSLFGIKKDQLKPLTGVKREFLEIAFKKIETEFGSLESYLSEGLLLRSSVSPDLKALLLRE